MPKDAKFAFLTLAVGLIIGALIGTAVCDKRIEQAKLEVLQEHLNKLDDLTDAINDVLCIPGRKHLKELRKRGLSEEYLTAFVLIEDFCSGSSFQDGFPSH